MTPIAIILIILLALFILLFFLIAPANARQQTTAFANQFIAHRGLHDAAAGIPENSLAAFDAARTHGYGAELDVRLTADGEVVVLHDPTPARMCGVDTPVCSMTLAQLRTLHLSDTQEHIPTLAEALDALGGMPLICELKTAPGDPRCAELCHKVDALLRSYPGPYGVESFSPLAVRWFYKNSPDTVRGILARKNRDRSLHGFLSARLCFNFLCRPDFIAYEHGRRPLALRAVRAMGALTVVWTIQNEAQLTRAEPHFDCFIFEKSYLK